ncbi:MAG: uroporphyrinogen-III synthase [Xanthomonadales bacterium]|jgi:uroporphyrinogen-III synthase|nr:uroporphyrinogen-III synthase [Xanthomonadales bacterium]
MTFTHALATRPEPQQTELVQGLAALGLDVVSLPAFDFEALPPPADLLEQARDALLVFTSPRAVAYGLTALGGALPKGARAAAIGPATGAALAAQGIEALQAPGTSHDSEALLATIDRQPAPGGALILAAPGGREALQRGFAERNWTVTLAPVYRRVPRVPDTAEASRLGTARKILSLWTSGVAMEQLLEGLGHREKQAVLAGTALVASGRLARLAERHGFQAVVTAENATNAALLAAARRCLEADPD